MNTNHPDNHRHGRVWMNPPYGPGIDRWLQRFCEHRNGIALIFARTDTQWFHTYVTRADAGCFTRGRIPFVSPATPSNHCGGPGCGSLLLAHGTQRVEALWRSGLGLLIDLRVKQRVGGPFPGWSTGGCNATVREAQGTGGQQ